MIVFLRGLQIRVRNKWNTNER